MSLQFEVLPLVLDFKFAAGTSRGTLKQKTSYLLKIWEESNPTIVGIGEAGPLPKLSIDDVDNFEQVFNTTVQKANLSAVPNSEAEALEMAASLPESYPSMRFALETALLDLHHGGKKCILKNDFVKGKKSIPINGLIWMGYTDFMMDQINKKIAEGYTCIKIKVGALNFDQELDVLEYLRKKFYKSDVTIRLDANGAFKSFNVMERLKALSKHGIHSIEQPVQQGQYDLMKKVCAEGAIQVALDEELIGLTGQARADMLDAIQPAYIILKPTLLGGIQATKEWIQLAEERNIEWWMTSALESNIGLNAIAQLTAAYDNPIPQGLGTGQLYHNNIEAPLRIEEGYLRFDTNAVWGI